MAIGLSTIESFTSCSKEPKIPTAYFYEATNATEMIERINGIGGTTLENEQLVETLYVNYTNLPQEEKAKVSNYDKLDEARNAITKLYHTEEKDGSRVDRSKILIGTYRMGNSSEELVQWLKEAINNETEIFFTLRDKNRRVLVYYPDFADVLEPDSNGIYTFNIKNAEGVFITAEPLF